MYYNIYQRMLIPNFNIYSIVIDNVCLRIDSAQQINHQIFNDNDDDSVSRAEKIIKEDEILEHPRVSFLMTPSDQHTSIKLNDNKLGTLELNIDKKISLLYSNDLLANRKVSSTDSIQHNLIYNADSFYLEDTRQDDVLFMKKMGSYTHVSFVTYNDDQISAINQQYNTVFSESIEIISQRYM